MFLRLLYYTKKMLLSAKENISKERFLLLRSLELIKIKTPDNQYTFHDHPEGIKNCPQF